MRTFLEFIHALGTQSSSAVSVSHDNLGISREDMPQMDGNVHRFLDHLRKCGIEVVEEESFPVGLVSLTQKEIILPKLEDIITRLQDGSVPVEDTPFILDRDGYLLDAQHRYLSLLYGRCCTAIRAFVVDLPIEELIDRAHAFLEAQQGNDEE